MKARLPLLLTCLAALPALLLLSPREALPLAALAEAGREMMRQRVRREQLETQTLIIKRCTAGKRRVVEQILAGQQSLHEAIAAFARLDEERCGALTRAGGWGCPVGEQEQGRFVIWWVKQHAPPQARAPVLRKLMEEYRERFGVDYLDPGPGRQEPALATAPIPSSPGEIPEGTTTQRCGRNQRP